MSAPDYTQYIPKILLAITEASTDVKTCLPPSIPQYPVTVRATAMRIFQTRSLRSNQIARRRDGKAFSHDLGSNAAVFIPIEERLLTAQPRDPDASRLRTANRPIRPLAVTYQNDF